MDQFQSYAQADPSAHPETAGARPEDPYRTIVTGTPYPIRGLLTFGTNLLVPHAGAAAGIRTLETRDFHAHADIRACRFDYFTRT